MLGETAQLAESDEMAVLGRVVADLLRALTEALKVLREGGVPEAALQESFAFAQRGLGAKTALLLYIRHGDPLELKILRSSGLSYEQQLACQSLQSFDGVSPTVISQAITGRRSIFIPNAQSRAELHKTSSLAGGAHLVLCAPVIDPLTGAAIAVLYFQNKGLALAFGDDDHAWLAGYATALGQAFGLHLSKERRVQELVA